MLDLKNDKCECRFYIDIKKIYRWSSLKTYGDHKQFGNHHKVRFLYNYNKKPPKYNASKDRKNY